MNEAYALWLHTGWNDGYRVSVEEFVESWRMSAVRKCILQNGAIVAIGRANSDGILYSMIHDIVVHPDHRDKGLGKRVVLEIVDELKKMGVRSIQLMAAVGQIEFYRKLGFDVRPENGPGMQYSFRDG